MRIASGIVFWAATLVPCGAAWADGAGLATDADRVPWPRLQGRITYSAYPAMTTPWHSELAPGASSGLKLNGWSVMGDLYFDSRKAGDKAPASGFRATSGVIVGMHSKLWGTAPPNSGLLSVDRRLFGQSPAFSASAADLNADNATLPYIGIGYSSLIARSGWSFSADLGLVSLSPSNAVRLGRVFGGGQSLDDVVRDMRLAPVLQLGVSYSF